MNIFALVAVNTLVVVLAVLIHYEFLFRLSKLLPKIRIRHRFRVVVGVAGALVAHVFEIWMFALAYYLMINKFGWGTFTGNFTGAMSDCFYFSFTTYTTLGFGDIQPIGGVRYLTGVESLTGLVLITWSASYLYLEMQNYWGEDKNQ